MLQVGQELWWVPTDSRYVARSCTVRVKKVGRKWATLDNYERINTETLWAYSGQYSSAGRCWITREAWDAEQRRIAHWDRLKGMVAGFGVPDVSEAAILEAIAALENGTNKRK